MTEYQGTIISVLSEAGCCSSCILRYIGQKTPKQYEDSVSTLEKFGSVQDSHTYVETPSEEPPPKKKKQPPCVCCLGLLQDDNWPDVIQKVQSATVESRYESDTFACALTYPMCTLVREHSINLFLKEKLPQWTPDNVTSLKEAWKWSFGVKLASALNKTLNSGAICHFLIKANMAYSSDIQELEPLRRMAPYAFNERERSHRKYHGEMFTKRCIETVLNKVDKDVFKQHSKCPPDQPDSIVECTTIECSHSPIYIAGRYCKYSRELSQTPWILQGKRMMESSIQEILFAPLLKYYNISEENGNSKLKFLSSGREDVDVRCIGEGRPFSVEILEPRGVSLSKDVLKKLSKEMGEDKSKIFVRDLQIVSKDELAILKSGEETKTKTYVALCIRLDDPVGNIENSHQHENGGTITSIVTNADIEKLNNFSNRPNGEIVVVQKTPLRVLHRRPLLNRNRTVYELKAALVPDKPNLFIAEMTTQAGTYIKEFVHGDFGRSYPSLYSILGYKVDILALDVTAINLDWPKKLDEESLLP